MNGDNAKIFLQDPEPQRGRNWIYLLGAVLGGLTLAGAIFYVKYVEPNLESKQDSQAVLEGADAGNATASSPDDAFVNSDGSPNVSKYPPDPRIDPEYNTPAIKPPKPPDDMDVANEAPPAPESRQPAKAAPEKPRETPRKKSIPAAVPQPVKEVSNGTVTKVTAANFGSQVEHAKGVVLVDFWAPWCGPCRKVGPIVDELAGEFKGTLKVAKVNVDDAPTLANRFRIDSIPCLMIFKDGKLIDRQVGGQPKEALKAWLKKYAK